MDETLDVNKKAYLQGNRFLLNRNSVRVHPEMNVQRKPHPYSIEVILGLKDTATRRTQSFRPYYRTKEHENKGLMNDLECNTLSRLVPRLGLVPASPAWMETLKINRERSFSNISDNACSPMYCSKELKVYPDEVASTVTIPSSQMDGVEREIERSLDIDQGKLDQTSNGSSSKL